MSHNPISKLFTRRNVEICGLITLSVFGMTLIVEPELNAEQLPFVSAESSEYKRPAGWTDYRPAVHLTPARHWMNDPQRPLLIDGVWHYYYLYNSDYPDGNGTEWYHATSTDLVHWQEHGVAIDKYKNGLGDIQTGSAVVDTRNTAGFGSQAVIAMVTQQHEGVQRQSLFVSTDGGYRFEPYQENPVMDNPGADDWRDPKIVWDNSRNEWLMVLAEGHKIGFYTSPDLKHWTYKSAFQRDDLGLLECPDLFLMSIDGDPEKTRWVLASGANGTEQGMTTGTLYWTGEWDGEHFTTDYDEPKWLDKGADFYAAVTWDDPRQSHADRLASRYSIGWLNNWAYATKLPTTDWQGGANSVVRRIELRTIDGTPQLVSHPVNAFDKLEGKAEERTHVRVKDAAKLTLSHSTPDAYRLRIKLDAASDASEVSVRLKESDEHLVIVGYNFEQGAVFIKRDKDAIADTMPDVYREIRQAAAPARDGVVTMDIIVDTTSIEVFVNDGEIVLSDLIFTVPGANKLSVESSGGDTELHLLQLVPLKIAPIKRLNE